MLNFVQIPLFIFLKSGGCIQYVFVSMSIQSHLGK